MIVTLSEMKNCQHSTALLEPLPRATHTIEKVEKEDGISAGAITPSAWHMHHLTFVFVEARFEPLLTLYIKITSQKKKTKKNGGNHIGRY